MPTINMGSLINFIGGYVMFGLGGNFGLTVLFLFTVFISACGSSTSAVSTSTGTGSTFQIEGTTWTIQKDGTTDVSSAGWTLSFASNGHYTNYRRDVVAAVDSTMSANCAMDGTYSAVTATTLTVDITADSCWTPKQIATNTGMAWSIDDTVTPNVLTFAGFTANKQ